MKPTAKFLAALAAASAIAAGCTNYDSEISRLDDRIDRIEDTQIKSVSQQIEAISTTIEKLRNADSEINGYVKEVQSSAEKLKESIDAADRKIDEVKAALDKAVEDAKASDSAMKDELVKSVSDAKADVLAQLSSMKTEMTGKLAQLNETVSTLEDKSKIIEGRITELNAFVTSQTDSTREWVSTTFVSLKEYSGLVTEVASIKETVSSLSKSLEGMETKLGAQWKSDIETAVAPVRKQIEDAVNSVTNAYADAISAAKSEVTEAYRAEMKESIASLRESLESWISGKFGDYWTIEETKAELNTQKSDFEAQLNAQKAYLEGLVRNLGSGSSGGSADNTLIVKLNSQIESVGKTAADNADAIESLRSDLNDAAEGITKAYRDAIATAINEYDGRITGTIGTKISELSTAINDKISGINDKVTALDTRVTDLGDSVSVIKSKISSLQDEINALKEKISGIIGKMVSISHVPTYDDCSEDVTFTVVDSTIVPGNFTLNFDILPSGLASELAAVWNKALSVKARYTKTRAVSAGDYAALDIESASAADGILSVRVSADSLDDAFFKGEIPALVQLKISDGTREVLSEYIKLNTDGGSIDYGEGVTIDNLTWAPVNCGATYFNLPGNLYTFYSAQEACPEGWRTPTIYELHSLAAHYSAYTTYNGNEGYWLSGSREYSFGVPAIFIPCKPTTISRDYSKYWSSNTQISINESGSSDSAYVLVCGTGGVNAGSTCYPVSRKFPVRCVKK